MIIYAMQADSLSRFFAVTVTDNGEAWMPPDGVLWTVRFGAPQLPAGWYDTITETGGGTHAAVTVSGNTLTVEIAEQALSTPGNNVLTVIAYTADGYQLAAWPFTLNVQAVPGLEAPAVTEYYNLLTAQVAQTLANAQAAAGSATAAASSATLSESWAVGGTGTRAGEDTNNAEYWAGQAQAAAGSAVSSFNGRTGAVVPQSGDYTAAMVGALAQDGTAVAAQTAGTCTGNAATATSASTCTGNSATATKLATPVSIGNASFDGSENLTAAQIGFVPSTGGGFSGSVAVGGDLYVYDSLYTSQGTQSYGIKPEAASGFEIVFSPAGAKITNASGAFQPIYASNVSGASSKRYKQSINSLTLEQALKILLMRPVSFEYNKSVGDPGEKYGLIAEELEQIDNTCVFYNADGAPEGINYTMLIPQIIKLLQHQNDQIDQLKTALEASKK